MIYNVEKAGYILLGRCGESHARTVEIDVSSYLEEWPDGAVTLLHRRHGEETIYPVASELQGGHLIWAPSSADTAFAGYGEAEVRVTVGGTVVKSKILHTVVEKSLTGQEVDTPEASKDWVDKVLEKVGDMTEVKAEAESIEYGQPAKAEYDKETGTLKLSIPEGKPGKDGQNGSQGPQGPQGEPGKDGSDAEVTAENIQSALGYAPVKDVQIAGTSILADGVANVPIASRTAPGAVGVDNYSIGVTDTNRLFLYGSRIGDIDARSGNIAIDPLHLDYAVKAAMCDGKGAAWTSTEQAAARSRMGLDKQYELIEEIVLEEEATLSRNMEPDGSPYNLSSLVLKVELPPTTKTGNIDINMRIGTSKWLRSYFISPRDASATKYGYTKLWVENFVYRTGWWTCVHNVGEFAQYYENPLAQNFATIADGNITAVNIGVALDIGTKIQIYGVRA